MKKIGLLLSCFILLSAFTCDNEPLEGDFETNNNENNNGNNNNNNGAAVFQVDFDGQTFVADQISATILEGGVMNITGLRGSNQESIILTLNGTTPGTYQLGIQDGLSINGGTYSEANGSSNVWLALTDGMTAQGEVVVTAIDTENMTISGTFQFTGTNPTIQESKEFTNGIFQNISFTDDLGDNTGGGENEFFANVDGVEFVEDAVTGNFSNLAGMTSISINATKNSLETIGITLPGDITPGTYDFESFSTPLAQYNLSTTDIFTGEGTVTITTHNTTTNKIIGTFQFTATPVFGGTGTGSYEITEGSFDVTYFE